VRSSLPELMHWRPILLSRGQRKDADRVGGSELVLH
jgi:hypothetical protein